MFGKDLVFLLTKDEMVHQYKQIYTCKPLNPSYGYEELKKKKSETKHAKMGVKDTNKVCMPSLGMKINAYSSGFFFIAESIKVVISGIYFL